MLVSELQFLCQGWTWSNEVRSCLASVATNLPPIGLLNELVTPGILQNTDIASWICSTFSVYMRFLFNRISYQFALGKWGFSKHPVFCGSVHNKISMNRFTDSDRCVITGVSHSGFFPTFLREWMSACSCRSFVECGPFLPMTRFWRGFEVVQVD